MAASITDKFTETTNGTRPIPTTLSAQKIVSAPSISCAALTGWPTATPVHFAIYNTDASNNKVAGSQTDWKGIVSGSTITNLVLKAGTDQVYNTGATVQAQPTAAWADDLIEGLLVSFEQDGTLKSGAVDTTSVIADGIISEAKMTNGFLHGSDGYIDATDTWTYASATTFTILGVDRTTMFPKGTKLRITQTTDKYFYVVDSSFSTNTTVTITGGSDYSLANDAITNPRYSYMSSPQGFPQWFASAVTISAGMTLGNGTAISRFSISNGKMYLRGLITFGSTTTLTTSPTVATPVTMSSTAYVAASTDIGQSSFFDLSGGSTHQGTTRYQSTTSLLIVVSNVAASYPVQGALSSTVPFTWTTSDSIAWNIIAEI